MNWKDMVVLFHIPDQSKNMSVRWNVMKYTPLRSSSILF